MSSDEIRLLSHEKTYGGWDERGYAAANSAPKGTTGTLRACAGSACTTSALIKYYT